MRDDGEPLSQRSPLTFVTYLISNLSWGALTVENFLEANFKIKVKDSLSAFT